MSFNSLRNIFRWIGYILGVSVLLYQIFVSLHNIYNRHVVINIPVLVIALIMAFFSLGVQMLAWKSIMALLGIKLGYIEIIEGYIPSFLPRYLPGTIWGYLSRSEWLYHKFGISYKCSNIGSFFEILISLLSNIIVVGISFSPSPLGDIIMSGVILCIALFGLLALFGRYTQRWTWLKQNWPPFNLSSFNLWMISIILFIFTWIFNGLGLGFVIKGVIGTDIKFKVLQWVQLFGIYSLSWLMGFLMFFAPAGLGFRELTMTFMVSTFVPLSLESSGTISVISRLIILMSEFLWLLGSIFIKRTLRVRSIPKRIRP